MPSPFSKARPKSRNDQHQPQKQSLPPTLSRWIDFAHPFPPIAPGGYTKYYSTMHKRRHEIFDEHKSEDTPAVHLTVVALPHLSQTPARSPSREIPPKSTLFPTHLLPKSRSNSSASTSASDSSSTNTITSANSSTPPTSPLSPFASSPSSPSSQFSRHKKSKSSPPLTTQTRPALTLIPEITPSTHSAEISGQPISSGGLGSLRRRRRQVFRIPSIERNVVNSSLSCSSEAETLSPGSSPSHSPAPSLSIGHTSSSSSSSQTESSEESSPVTPYSPNLNGTPKMPADVVSVSARQAYLDLSKDSEKGSVGPTTVKIQNEERFGNLLPVSPSPPPTKPITITNKTTRTSFDLNVNTTLVPSPSRNHSWSGFLVRDINNIASGGARPDSRASFKTARSEFSEA